MTAIVETWNRFWFRPVPTSTVALFRVAYGFVAFVWTLTLVPDSLDLFGRHGVVAERDLPAGQWGLLNAFPQDWMLGVVLAVLLVGSLAVMVGFRAQVASIFVFVGLLSLSRRNPWVMNSGDALLRHLAFFLIFAPSSAALSVDRWRRDRSRFWEFPDRAPWALRLIQIQVSFVYLFTVWAKARSDDWIAGTAVFSTLRVGDLARFSIPYSWSESLLISNVLSYATLAIELALAILIWNRRARPWVIGAGVLLHLFIEVTVTIGFFSTVMFLSYVSFIPEDTSTRWWLRLRRWLGSRSVRWRSVAEPGRPLDPARGTTT